MSTLETVFHGTVARSRVVPASRRRRLVGTPVRGVLLLAIVPAVCVLAYLAGAVILKWQHWETAWTVLVVAVAFGVGAPVMIAIEEFRRPLWRFRDRTRGRGIRDGAELVWHPRIAKGIDEIRRTKQLNDEPMLLPTPPGFLVGGAVSVLRGLFSARLDARVAFDGDGGRIRTGSAARIVWSSRLTKGRIDGGYADFRLLCLRETPERLFRGGIECLADLSPSRRRDRRGERFEADLEFRIGADLPPSDLAAPQPTYWVLVASIDALAGPYREEFFVPVYPG